MPKEGFKIKIQPLLDLQWRLKFQNNALDRLYAVFEHAKTFINAPGLDTKFELDFFPVLNFPGFHQESGLKKK